MAEATPTLWQWQQTLDSYLLAAESQVPDSLRQLLATDTLQPATTDREQRVEAGLRIYRNNVIHSLTKALEAQFPVVARLVGAEFFGALARDYIRSEPPLQAALTLYGMTMPAFIRNSPACRPLQYLADVATLELLCQQALHAEDAAVLDPRILASVDPELLGDAHLHLHPSATLLQSPFPVHHIREENLKDEPGSINIEPGTMHYMLVYRKNLEVIVVGLFPAAFKLLWLLWQDKSLLQAWSDVEQEFNLNTGELGPLLGYLLGLEVFSTMTLSTGETQ